MKTVFTFHMLTAGGNRAVADVGVHQLRVAVRRGPALRPHAPPHHDVQVLQVLCQHSGSADVSSLRQKTAGRTDERIKVGTRHCPCQADVYSRSPVLVGRSQQTMNEVLQGMRVIKMYAWEKPFSQVQPT